MKPVDRRIRVARIVAPGAHSHSQSTEAIWHAIQSRQATERRRMLARRIAATAAAIAAMVAITISVQRMTMIERSPAEWISRAQASSAAASQTVGMDVDTRRTISVIDESIRSLNRSPRGTGADRIADEAAYLLDIRARVASAVNDLGGAE